MKRHKHTSRGTGIWPAQTRFGERDVAGFAAAAAPYELRARGEGDDPRADRATNRRFGDHLPHTDAYTLYTVHNDLRGKAVDFKGMDFPVCAIP